MAHWFNPPSINAGGEIRMQDQVVIQRSFLHDLATGQVDENGIILHAAKLGGANQAVGGAGERYTDQQNVGRLQELIQPLWRSHPVHSLICPTTPVNGMHSHTDTVHQPCGRGSDATKPENSADTTRKHAVPRELIKLATFEVFVLQDEALGGGKRHGESVLG